MSFYRFRNIFFTNSKDFKIKIISNCNDKSQFINTSFIKCFFSNYKMINQNNENLTFRDCYDVSNNIKGLFLSVLTNPLDVLSENYNKNFDISDVSGLKIKEDKQRINSEEQQNFLEIYDRMRESEDL